MDSYDHALSRLHRLGVISAIVVFSTTAALAIGLGDAGAARTTILGAAAPARPACPQNPCQAVGKVTGFQTSIGKTRKPFVAPFTGKVVAWSIKLSNPNEKQEDFFDNFYDGPPRARLAVLKPIRKQIRAGRPIYRLKSHSPVEDLNPYLGTTTTFALRSPLTVKEGQIVAISVPTWTPGFAVGQSGRTGWRGSRKPKRCNKPADIAAGKAHQTLGSERLYGCAYNTARLLYSATLVKRPR